MTKQCVKWKPVKGKNVHDMPIEIESPKILDIRLRGTLLTRILAMPPKEPISFSSAVHILRTKQRECFNARRFGDEPDHYGWYDLNFVEWISSLGHHIELTGDEFESYALSDKVA